ncbi:flavin reductase family protein [Rhodococcus sp. UFZ-B548]|uniref:flavin reductase family protein n=1 Tax=Rhodococcus sp. UFZ-B548 TaxID=2742212 RepID=UPI001C71142D
MDHNAVQPLDQSEFRHVVGHFASGVTIVTTEHDGIRYGATISAVTSLSADPPMVLVCVNQRLGTHAAIVNARRFTINILGEEQASLAQTFATPGANKFVGVGVVEGQHGLRLAEALAFLTCRVVHEVEGGTHRIFVAEVVEAQAGPGSPLSYFRGAFGQFVPHEKAS